MSNEQKIHGLCMDLQEVMRDVWKHHFPSGRLPDDLAAKVYILPEEFYKRLSEARRSTGRGT